MKKEAFSSSRVKSSQGTGEAAYLEEGLEPWWPLTMLVGWIQQRP